MGLVSTLWRDFTAQGSPFLVSVSGLGVDQLQDVHRDNEGSAVCPLGCQQELWLMVKEGASSGDAAKHSWKGCGGLGIVNWLLLVVGRIITIHFNQFLSLCIGEHKEN